MQSPSATILSRLTMEIAVALVTALAGAIVCYGSLEIGTG